MLVNGVGYSRCGVSLVFSWKAEFCLFFFLHVLSVGLFKTGPLSMYPRLALNYNDPPVFGSLHPNLSAICFPLANDM